MLTSSQHLERDSKQSQAPNAEVQPFLFAEYEQPSQTLLDVALREATTQEGGEAQNASGVAEGLSPSPSLASPKSKVHPRFDGDDYQPQRDDPRLQPQHARIRNLMADGEWRSLAQISALTGDPEASISAHLRHMRKPRFGGLTVERRYVGGGLYEYRTPRAA